MEFSDDDPQLGPADVDRAALSGPGIPLLSLALQLDLDLDVGSAADAPVDGWRILKRQGDGHALIGAPADHDGTRWRTAQVDASSPGSLVHVHSDSLALRPSRAERRRGLELRWPVHVLDPSGETGFVIDVVNTGDSRWVPNGDAFQIVGSFSAPGEDEHYVGGDRLPMTSASPLDPGEYARVRVSIPQGAWDAVEPGPYDLHALLLPLNLHSPAPFEVILSADTIDSYRALAHRAPMPGSLRRHAKRHLAELRAQLAAGASLDAIADAVAEADSDEDAIARLADLLDVGVAAATAVYDAPLRALRPGNAPQLRRTIEDVTRWARMPSE
jgi:hypothetical protein